MPPRLVCLFLLTASVGIGACTAIDDSFCVDKACQWSQRDWDLLRSLALVKDPPADPSNRYATDPAARALGQKLFYDANFSGPPTGLDPLGQPSLASRSVPPGATTMMISCATCHAPEQAGTDTSSSLRDVSVGAGTTDVNAGGTINAAYHQIFFRNGRADSLWALSVMVAESATTMNGNRLALAHTVVDRYAQAFSTVFGSALPGDWTAQVASLPPEGKPGMAAFDSLSDDGKSLVNRILVDWGKAIAAYEQELVSRHAPLDQFIAEGPDSQALSPLARQGALLFVGKAACINCHSGPLLTDELFHDIGVPQRGAGIPSVAQCTAGAPCDCVDGTNCLPWGAYDGLSKLKTNKWLRTSMWSDDINDQLRSSYTNQTLDDGLKGAWRTPSLRNVAQTAPYMHDGVFETLEDVIWHYNSGGAPGIGASVGTLAPGQKPLGLTTDEVSALAAFLTSLTGDPIDASLTTADPGGTP